MQLQALSNYYFDDFTLDVRKRQLLRGGEMIQLNPKAFDLLLVLVQGAGQLLTKDVLFERVWQDQIVEESNLTVNMSAIRRALGERASQPRYITTVSGEGYCFVGDVRDIPDEEEEFLVETHTVGRIMVEQVEPESEPLLLPAAVHRSSRYKLIAAGLIAVVTLGAGAYLLRRSLSSMAMLSGAAASIKKLTSNGKAGQAALSPDNKLFAFAVREANTSSLWLGYIDGGEPIQISPPAETLYLSLRFAPDGASLYYVASANFSRGELYRIPVLGGAPEKLSANIRSTVAFAPDGKRLAFVTNDDETRRQIMVATDLQGANEERLAEAPEGYSFVSGTLEWSQDGKYVAIGAANLDGSPGRIFVINTSGKTIEPLAANTWTAILGLEWLHDGSALIVVAREKDELGTQLWQVAYPGGESHRLVTDLNTYGGSISLSGDDKNLLAVQVQQESNIWSAPADDLGRAKQITFGSPGQNNGWYGLKWLRDGRVIYTKQDNNNISIWSRSADGSSQKALIPGTGINILPSVPDNESCVVFQSNRGGSPAVWRANMDGSDLVQLSREGIAAQPRVSPDGQWVVYVSDREGEGDLMRVPILGGEPVKLTDTRFSWVGISPDSQLIAGGCDENGKGKLCILPIGGGSPLKTFDIPRLANFRLGVQWTPDGQSITYRDWGNGIWKQNTSGGEPVLLKDLPEEKLYSYGWSPDGKHFAYTRGAEIDDVVFISGLGQL